MYAGTFRPAELAAKRSNHPLVMQDYIQISLLMIFTLI